MLSTVITPITINGKRRGIQYSYIYECLCNRVITSTLNELKKHLNRRIAFKVWIASYIREVDVSLNALEIPKTAEKVIAPPDVQSSG